MAIGKRRLRYLEDKFDKFLNGLFKEGEMLEVRIKPSSSSRLLEVTFTDVSNDKRIRYMKRIRND